LRDSVVSLALTASRAAVTVGVAAWFATSGMTASDWAKPLGSERETKPLAAIATACEKVRAIDLAALEGADGQRSRDVERAERLVRAEQHGDLPAGHLERQLVNREGSVREPLRHVA
jgi:hypothetical protein